jgi:hypothetical protein
MIQPVLGKPVQTGKGQAITTFSGTPQLDQESPWLAMRNRKQFSFYSFYPFYWSAGILPAREKKTFANHVWSAGILPAREKKTFANHVWSAGILPASALPISEASRLGACYSALCF